MCVCVRSLRACPPVACTNVCSDHTDGRKTTMFETKEKTKTRLCLTLWRMMVEEQLSAAATPDY